MTTQRLIDALTRLSLDQSIGDELRGSRAGAAAGQALADGLRGCVKAHASLDLYDLNLTDAGALPILHSLAEWPGCTSLDLGSNRLGFSSATALGPLLLLEPPPGADDLFRLPDETEEEAASASTAAAVPIRELRLARNGPTFDGVACAALLSPPIAPDGRLALSSLALSFSPIGEGGGVALGAALLAGRLPQLQTLQVQGCALGAEGVAGLAQGLPASRSLHHLDLSDNDAGDGGACALAAELPNATSLIELLLGRNKLGDTAAHALATALVKRTGGTGGGGSRLRLLSLANNLLRNAGAQALADALTGAPPHGNRTLTTLDLRANKLSTPALLALGDALVANPRITALDLGGHKRIDAEGLAAVESLLRQNRTAARRLKPPERVAPNEAASSLADLHIQRLFTSEASTPQQPLPTGGVASSSSSLGALGGGVATTESIALHTEVKTALGNLQEDLETAGREVARLRQREATLERALKKEFSVFDRPRAWEYETLR